MSRIYDALQRAEKTVNPDLSNAQFGQGGDTAETAIAVQPEVALQTPPAREATPPPAVTRNRDVAKAAIAVETGFEEVPCRIVEWNVNPAAMVALRRDRMSRMANEQFRTLRSRLYQLRSLAPLKTLVITSAAPAEGKSFVAANLAHVLARQTGRRCLLIDGDLRRSTLSHYLGAEQAPGLTEFVRGNATADQVVQHGNVPGLYFAPAGEPVSDPAELVAAPKLREWVERASQMFDWIIIDSPPAVTVSDASRLAEFADGVLLVVRAGSTTAESAVKLREELKHTKVVGAVFNNFLAPSYYHYYYYKYDGSGSAGDDKETAEIQSESPETAVPVG